jgi:hypothetical protein
LVSAALFAVTAVVAGAEGLDVSSHPMIGEAAPACDLEEVAGGKVGPESLRGRYVVRHFGTSW